MDRSAADLRRCRRAFASKTRIIDKALSGRCARNTLPRLRSSVQTLIDSNISTLATSPEGMKHLASMREYLANLDYQIKLRDKEGAISAEHVVAMRELETIEQLLERSQKATAYSRWHSLAEQHPLLFSPTYMELPSVQLFRQRYLVLEQRLFSVSITAEREMERAQPARVKFMGLKQERDTDGDPSKDGEGSAGGGLLRREESTKRLGLSRTLSQVVLESQARHESRGPGVRYAVCHARRSRLADLDHQRSPSRPSRVRIYIASTGEDAVAERALMRSEVLLRLQDLCHERHLQIELVDVHNGWDKDRTADSELKVRFEGIDSCDYFIAFLGDKAGHVSSYYGVPAGKKYSWLTYLERGVPTLALELKHGGLNDASRCGYAWLYVRGNAGMLSADPEVQRLQKMFRSCGRPCSPYDEPQASAEAQERLVDDIVEKLAGAIAADFSVFQVTESQGEETPEAVFQSSLRRTRALRKTFSGRDQPLQGLKRYMKPHDNPVPLMIAGESGCGITALLSHQLDVYHEASPSSHLIAVEIGTSAASRDIRRLLRSLLISLADCFVTTCVERFDDHDDHAGLAPDFQSNLDPVSTLVLSGSSLARYYSPRQIVNLTRAFVHTDQDGDGRISLNELFALTGAELTNRDMCDLLGIAYSDNLNLAGPTVTLGTFLTGFIRLYERITFKLDELRPLLPVYLGLASSKSEVLVVLDGVDRLDNVIDCHQMYWLPYLLPSKVRLILSVDRESTIYGVLRRRKPAPREILIGPLGFHDRHQLLGSFMSASGIAIKVRTDQSHQSSPSKHDFTHEFDKKIDADSPLYVELASLYLIEHRARLDDAVLGLPDRLEGLCLYFVRSLVSDSLYGKCVHVLLCALAISRDPVPRHVLKALIEGVGFVLTEWRWLAVLQNLCRILCIETIRGVMLRQDLMREVIRREFQLGSDSPAARAIHTQIADVLWMLCHGGGSKFSPEAAASQGQLVYHSLQGRQWDYIKSFALNLDVFQARCRAGDAGSLLADCELLMDFASRAKDPALSRRGPEIYASKDVLRIRARPPSLSDLTKDDPNLNDSNTSFATVSLSTPEPHSKAYQPKRETPWNVGRQSQMQGDGTVMTRDLVDLYDFTFKEIDILHQRPSLTFQQAGHEPTEHWSTASSRDKWEKRTTPVPFTAWVSKPHFMPPNTVSIDEHECVTAVALSPNQSIFLTALEFDDRKTFVVRIWDRYRVACRNQIRGFKSPVVGLHFAGDYNFVATTTHGALAVFDIHGTLHLEASSPSQEAITAVGFFAPLGQLATGSANGTLRVWEVDFATSSELTMNVTHSSMKTQEIVLKCRSLSCSFFKKHMHSSEISTIAVCTSQPIMITGGLDGWVRCLYLNGRIVWEYDSRVPVYASAFGAQGRRVAYSTRDNSVHIADAADGKTLMLFRLSVQVGKLCFTDSDKRLIMVCDDTTIRIAPTTGRQGSRQKNFVEETSFLRAHNDTITAFCISQDTHTLVSGDESGGVHLWTRNLFLKLKDNSHTSSVSVCAFAPTGLFVISGDTKGCLKMWKAKTGDFMKDIKLDGKGDGVTALVVSPDDVLLLAGRSSGAIDVWDLVHSAHLYRIDAHFRAVISLEFSGDGRFLTSSSDDATVGIIDVHKGQKVLSLNHDEPVLWCSFTPDGTRIFTASNEPFISVWDPSDLSRSYIFEDAQVFTEDGFVWGSIREDCLVVAGAAGSKVHIGSVPHERHMFSLNDHSGAVRACSFLPDGLHLVSWDSDDLVYLWAVTEQRGSLLTRYTITTIATRHPTHNLKIGLLSRISEGETGLNVAIGLADGELELFRLCGIPAQESAVGCLVYQYHYRHWPGRYDRRPTIKCCQCGYRNNPANADISQLIDASRATTWDIDPNTPMWERGLPARPSHSVKEPQEGGGGGGAILTACPHCKQVTRLISFVLDDRDVSRNTLRYIMHEASTGTEARHHPPTRSPSRAEPALLIEDEESGPFAITVTDGKHVDSLAASAPVPRRMHRTTRQQSEAWNRSVLSTLRSFKKSSYSHADLSKPVLPGIPGSKSVPSLSRPQPASRPPPVECGVTEVAVPEIPGFFVTEGAGYP